MEFNINKLTRKNIKQLLPYSSARVEYKGRARLFLDANENSFESEWSKGLNRYPDPLQLKLKNKLSKLKGVANNELFIGNGSDEAIDLLFRAFCEPRKDEVIICPPTYGMYEVCANINNVKAVNVPLIKEIFQLDTKNIVKAINKNTKLIFLCCPNNPTGNGVKWKDIKVVLEKFNGIVVVDEAYIDFASYRSLISELKNYPNLVILQTLSKAWGLAGIRIGLSFASKEVISIFNKIKPPYNINALSQERAIKALSNTKKIKGYVKTIISEREKLKSELEKFDFVLKIYPSEANFILVKTTNALKIHSFLLKKKIVVRNRSSVSLCEECLRITIGAKKENTILLNALKKYKK